MLWIKIEITDNYLIFKVKAIQKCKHCQICVLPGNSSDPNSSWLLLTQNEHSLGLPGCEKYMMARYLSVAL